MIQELYIEKTKMDLTADQAALITLAIDDIKDFGAKNTGFSKTIVLPGTVTNDKVFNYFFDVNVRTQYTGTAPHIGSNFNAAIGAESVLFSDHIQTFKGVARLVKIVNYKTHHEYEVLLFGELGGLINKIGNKKLEELPFDTTLQTYSQANIAGTTISDSTIFTDYIYPLIDYGTYSTGKHHWKYRTFRPAIFVKNYIEKIFTMAGYTLDMPLLSTARFEKLIVPYNRKDFTKKSSQYFSGYTSSSGFTDSETVSVPGSYVVPFSTSILGNFTNAAGLLTNTGAGVTFDMTLNIDAVFTQTDVNYPLFTDTYLAIVMYKNGTEYWRDEVLNGYYNIATVLYNYSNTINTITLATADSVFFQFEFVRNDGDITLVTVLNTFTVDMNGLQDEFVTINIGETFKIADCIPRNYLQKTFLSDIVKLFNLYIFEDKNVSKLIKIKPFVDFYNDNVTPPVDWSGKLDRSKPVQITPMGELNSRYYQFNFAKDNDYWNDLYFKRYNEQYGSRLFDSEFEMANETAKVEIQFSGTPLVGYVGEDKVYSAIYKQTNSGEERTDSVIRILQYKEVTGVTSFNIQDDAAATLIAKTTYIYAGHLDDPDAPTNDINFGAPKELFFTLATGALNVNQFNVYWSSYMAEITDPDSKILEAWIRLSVTDIDVLDFSQKIFIDGQIWRLNKVIDYNAGSEDICKAEFLNIINTTY